MRTRTRIIIALLVCGITLFSAWAPAAKPSLKKQQKAAPLNGRYLFAATPGIRDYLGYGGHGLLIFDIDHGHKFVKRIPFQGLHPKNGKPSNVKGIGISIPLNSIYVTTLESLQRIDIASGKVLWEKFIEGGCDRLAV